MWFLLLGHSLTGARRPVVQPVAATSGASFCMALLCTSCGGTALLPKRHLDDRERLGSCAPHSQFKDAAWSSGSPTKHCHLRLALDYEKIMVEQQTGKHAGKI